MRSTEFSSITVSLFYDTELKIILDGTDGLIAPRRIEIKYFNYCGQ